MADRLSKEEFCERFKAHMLKRAAETFDDGESIADYADETAPSSFKDQHMQGESPEDCSEADMEY